MTQGSVGPQDNLDAVVIHADGSKAPANVSPVQKLLAAIKGLFSK